MNYGNVNDDNYYRFAGWEESTYGISEYFSDKTVKIISHKVSQLLEGVDPQGRKIIVPNDTITSVMSQIYNSFRPPTGDIYGRYNIPTNEPENYNQDMINQVIEVITSDVKANIGMEECNRKLTAWTTVLGDFNEHKLRQYSTLKVRDKNTNFRGHVSFMNY
jgi:hypothetical protein